MAARGRSTERVKQSIQIYFEYLCCFARHQSPIPAIAGTKVHVIIINTKLLIKYSV
jgi:hypothetical protein